MFPETGGAVTMPGFPFCNEGIFIGESGIKIFNRRYQAKPEKARLVIAHGLGEHSGRYDNVVERLVPEGISIWALDHRGHGQSEGIKGHVFSFYQYIAELYRMVEIARDKMPEGVKIFLLGHSLGGLIALRFVASFPKMIDGVIVSSPALGLTSDIPAAKAFAGKIMSAFFPTFGFGNDLDVSKISHDEDVVRAYMDDPLVHNRVSARWFTEFLSAMKAAGHSAPEIKIPILMQLAGDDHLTNAGTSANFFEALGSEDKTLHIYKDLYHEIYNEKKEQRKQVLDDLNEWLMKRT
jgi:alpha-beta hydrolase superfamily lysophospholipase